MKKIKHRDEIKKKKKKGGQGQLLKQGVVWIENWKTMPPKDVSVLNPKTCEYGTLHDKRDFVDGIKLRALR